MFEVLLFNKFIKMKIQSNKINRVCLFHDKNQWASKEEINVVISEALFKVEVLLNWIPYHLMR